MKIVSGKYSGRKLISPDNRNIRPTSDKVRGAVFNMLASRDAIDGVNVLDICCGTGAMGLEALSRGANKCTFMDISRVSLGIAKENAVSLGVIDHCSFENKDGTKLSARSENLEQYGLVFLDPPYNKGLVGDILLKLLEGKWISEGGWIVCESEKQYDVPETTEMIVDSMKKYGDIKITLVRYAS